MGQSDNSEAWIRAMLPADLPALVDLWVASWREAMPEIDFEVRRAWIAAFLQAGQHATRVAVDRAGALGFVSLEGAHLHQLVVAPSAKGSGVAKALLGDAKARYPGGLTLDVNQANDRAVAFYIREGFVTASAGVNPTSGLATWAMRWP